MLNLWLDDIRVPPDSPEWENHFHAKTAVSAIQALKTQEFSVISLDHDLGLKGDNGFYPGDGYDVLLWIELQVRMNGYKPPVMEVHSSNPVARERMLKAIEAINRAAGIDT